MSGKLSIVATPIGNLGDISQRACETLKAADFILAEDTRVTRKLLKALNIEAKLERCDENVIASKTPQLIDRLNRGEHLAFCSDAGMPGISDPGLFLVDAARDAQIEIEVLPGASALDCAYVSAGFQTGAFYFGGFLSRKHNLRIKQLKDLSFLDAALIFYESPHRVLSSLEDIAQVFPNRDVALCRELTKLHEEVIRMPSSQLFAFMQTRDSIKGECVLVIGPEPKQKRKHKQKYPSKYDLDDANNPTK